MSKTTVFQLNVTLKAGSNVYLKGTKFDESTLPPELKPEVDGETGTIQVISFGEDFEGSDFEPEKGVTLKKKLIGRPKKLIKT